MRTWKAIAVSSALAASLTSLAAADIIELKDGRKIPGSMVRQGDTMLIRGNDGTTLSVAPTDVLRVTLTSSTTPAQAAASDWTRIALEIKKADDLASIIDLHQKFLEKYPDVPLAKDVTASLGVYQQLAKSDAVKFRGRWMPRAQIDVTLKQWQEAVRPARDLYHTGRLKDAIDAAKAVIAKDDTNPEAWAIAGLAAYRLNNLPQARAFFTSLAASDPGGVLAENNLAVVSYQQKQLGEALVHYTKALQIMPENRLLLDNIAEAIHTYIAGGGEKTSQVYRTLLRQYEPAETKMESAMAQKKPASSTAPATAPAAAGFKRWGATWVAADQFDALLKYQQVLQDRMSQMEAGYQSMQQSFAGLDAQAKQAQADYEDARLRLDYNNSQILLLQQRALDTAFVIAQRDVAVHDLNLATQQKIALDTQRARLQVALEQARAQADKLKAAFGGNLAQVATSPGQYTGIQRIMDLGEDETPPPPVPVAPPPDLPAIGPVVIVQP